MASFNSLELKIQEAEVAEALTEIIGEKLPKKLRRKIEPEKYALLRECKPFGDRSVREVARERGIKPKRLWRWLHRTRLELESWLIEQIPQRIGLLIDCGRELREQSCKLDHAEDYLKRAEQLVLQVQLPDNAKHWYRAKCALELGHVYRDRGDKKRQRYAVQTYGRARDAFEGLSRDLSRPWSNPDAQCGWIVAVQSGLQMKKTEAIHKPKSAYSFYRGAILGYERLVDALKDAPAGYDRYQERRAENCKMLGGYLRLAGDPAAAVKLLTEAYNADEGSPGDHVSRAIRRAQGYVELGQYDKAFADLSTAEKRLDGLKTERGIYGVILGKAYCMAYKACDDHSAAEEKGRVALASARRLGLHDQIGKISRILFEAPV